MNSEQVTEFINNLKIESFSEYVPLALRTESKEWPDTAWQSKIPERLYRVNHALTGLSTEIGEVLEAFTAPNQDIFNIKEEIGDIWWYVAILTHELGMPLTLKEPIVSSILVSDTINSIMINHGNCFDVVKRRMYYGSGDDDKKASWDIVKNNSYSMVAKLTRLTILSGLSLKEVWESNIAKLAKRYPDKFTMEDAINRDLDAEREVLEGK